MQIKFISAIITIFLSAVFVFGQVDVPRETKAATYPLDENVNVSFRGTTRFPRMKGEAKIKRTAKNGTEIDLSVSKMPRPFELGAGYATYVLWAISPDGQADNLGEIKRRGTFDFDSKISVTTPLQTFALIVTAEPHFLVRRPSRAVMLENLNPFAASGRNLMTTAAIQYFGNSSDYFNDARTPEIAEYDYAKTPSALLQARQAIALAKFAGAERDATDELNEAETLYQNAENSFKAGRAEEDVDVTARRAVSVAVKAENTAVARKEARERRNEKTRNDAEIRKAEDKYSDAQNQITDVRAELASETRRRELAERDVENYRNQVLRLQADLDKVRGEAQDAKMKLARIEVEKETLQKQQDKSERLNRLAANSDVLMQSLKRFGTVEKTERGIVLTVPENVWATVRGSEFAANADQKISELGNVLANTADYKISVESHTDNKGTPEELEGLTNARAQIFAEKLTGYGVTADRLESRGFGASLPVAPNTTNANRAKNRRVLIILAPGIQ